MTGLTQDIWLTCFHCSLVGADCAICAWTLSRRVSMSITAKKRVFQNQNAESMIHVITIKERLESTRPKIIRSLPSSSLKTKVSQRRQQSKRCCQLLSSLFLSTMTWCCNWTGSWKHSQLKALSFPLTNRSNFFWKTSCPSSSVSKHSALLVIPTSFTSTSFSAPMIKTRSHDWWKHSRSLIQRRNYLKKTLARWKTW